MYLKQSSSRSAPEKRQSLWDKGQSKWHGLLSFYDDKNPSMKVDQRFHCFGCGEDGDVIDFTAKLFDLSQRSGGETGTGLWP